MNVTELIKSRLHIMTRSEHKIAMHFLERSDDFAFETLDDIAIKIDTSTTSVLRFCRRLDFSGYKELQEAVRREFKHKMTLPDKFRRTVEGAEDTRVQRTVKNSVSCIEKTFADLTDKQLNGAAGLIATAKRVFCFGLRESFALSHYAYTRFLNVRDNVFILNAGNEIESVLNAGKGDVCIFFLFHRYTKPAPEILTLLKNQGVTVILITSAPYEELEASASVLLPCFVDVNGIKNSAVAPICIIDHLCNSVAVEIGDNALDYMKRAEALFDEFTF